MKNYTSRIAAGQKRVESIEESEMTVNGKLNRDSVPES